MGIRRGIAGLYPVFVTKRTSLDELRSLLVTRTRGWAKCTFRMQLMCQATWRFLEPSLTESVTDNLELVTLKTKPGPQHRFVSASADFTQPKNDKFFRASEHCS
jgi:hypothetical protein